MPESVSARVVTLLLDRGLDVESPFVTSDGCDTVNAVWFAVARGRNRTLVKLLIKRGGTPNGLYAAGWWEDIEMLDLLIRSGAPIDVADCSQTCLADIDQREPDLTVTESFA